MRRRRFNCAYCQRPLIRNGCARIPPHSRGATRDHVIPQCEGGERTVRACFACNNLKGAMPPHVWGQFMAANPRWWTLAKGCVGG